MDSTYDRLKAALLGAVFHPPANKEQIAAVEKELAAMADMLFERDDKRRQEENRLG